LNHRLQNHRINLFLLVVFQAVEEGHNLIEAGIFEIEAVKFATSKLFEEAELITQCFYFEENVVREQFTLDEYQLFSKLFSNY